VYILDGASIKFITNSHVTDYSVWVKSNLYLPMTAARERLKKHRYYSLNITWSLLYRGEGGSHFIWKQKSVVL
jgi:hypothetical protein